MQYNRMPIEIESPEETGYDTIRYNLSESSVADRTFGSLGLDLSAVLLSYTEHRGILPLRTLIAAESPVLSADDVLVTAGAAMALFVTATTLLRPEDHIIVIRPNYATNIETPRAIGCAISLIDLDFDQDFDLDPERIRQAIQPNTKIISLTNPHNPTGKVFPTATILAIIQMAEAAGCYVVVDETYRDLNFQTPLLPYFATLSDRVISISSLSKAFGVPGIRIGWLICRDQQLMHTLLAAKEQILLGNAILDEHIALHLLQQKSTLIPAIHTQIRENFAYFKEWFAQQPFLEWVEPQAGVVCFPRLKKAYKFNFDQFRKDLYERYQTFIGFGHWFEQGERYFRLGYAFPNLQELKEGLACFETCLKAHCMLLQFNPFPTLTTNRLVLRQLEKTDDAAIFVQRSDPRMLTYIDIPVSKNIGDAQAFIQKINTFIANNESMYWAISRHEAPELIGTICLWNFEPEHQRAELGYAINPDFQGKGFAQEAIDAVLLYGFNTLQLHSIVAFAVPENLPSINALQKKGFSITDNGDWILQRPA